MTNATMEWIACGAVWGILALIGGHQMTRDYLKSRRRVITSEYDKDR